MIRRRDTNAFLIPIMPKLPTRLICVLALIVATALRAQDYAFVNFAGTGNTAGSANGTPGTFSNPYGIAIDADKNLYIADTVNNLIRKITPARVVSTLAGTAGFSGTLDGTGAAARFNFPVGIAADGSGNIYVSDANSFTIRKITAAGVVTTFAGTPFQIGSTDGTGAAARFFLPYGVATDAQGNVYVAEGGNHLIRKITPAGAVTTLAGGAQQPGNTNGTGGAARFNIPFGVAVDSAGNVFVADSGNNVIRRVTAAGVVTTFAGDGLSGAFDGTGTAARFNQPRGVAVGAGGVVYVADYGNSVIRAITSAGVVTTVAGTAGIVGEVNSVGPTVRFYDPTGIVADGTTVYVADTSNNLVRRGVPASSAGLPEINIHPIDQEIAVGQSITFRVTATGSSLTYQWLRNTVVIPGATASTYTIASPVGTDAAVYSARVSGPTGSVDSTGAGLTVHPVVVGTIPITARPIGQSVNTGQAVSFSVTATGSGLTYQWLKAGVPIAGATASTYAIAAVTVSSAGTYGVRITAGAATETPTAKLIVDASAGAPVTITSNPSSQTVNTGQPVTFSVTATGTGALTYQWLKNDTAIVGATAANFTIASTQASDTGSYTARVSVGSASVTSAPAILTVGAPPPPPGPTARLSNLSVRTTLAASQTLIVGVVVSGGSRDVLVRAVGPALAVFGLTGVMADPRLDLYNGQTVVFSNDDWPANLAPTFASVGAFALPAASKDSAFVQGIDGPRSIQARGTGAGVVLVEAYDLGTGNSPRMINVSARNQVGTGDNILIAGFNVAGTGTKQLLIRAVGPTLADFGVTGTLVDPKLELYSGAGVKITENDNWAPALGPTFTAVGAFQLTGGSRDAALLATLEPGSYTVQVSGVGGGTGEALVEVYEVPLP